MDLLHPAYCAPPGRPDHDRAEHCLSARTEKPLELRLILGMEAGSFETVSTTRRDWKRDCELHVKARVPFKLMGIQLPAHRDFVLQLAARQKWIVAHGDGVAYLAPPEKRIS
jgi:hypothetical protein